MPLGMMVTDAETVINTNTNTNTNMGMDVERDMSMSMERGMDIDINIDTKAPFLPKKILRISQNW
jgi:hypothetical protein